MQDSAFVRWMSKVMGASKGVPDYYQVCLLHQATATALFASLASFLL
jgi:hypothetical protein